MDKNKIKNKLQKIYNRGIDPSDNDRPPDQYPSLRNNQSFVFKSTRRGKLSLSKDLSNISNPTITSSHSCKHQHSLRESKRAYINLVSNPCQKDLSFLSSSKICIANNDQATQRSKPKQKGLEKNIFFHQEGKNHNKNNSSFDAKQLRDLAINIAKSTTILNEKIVPVLLQAAKHTLKQEKSQCQLGSTFLASTTNIKHNPQNKRHTHHQKQLMLQTPINQLKYQSFDQNEDQQAYVHKSSFNRCQTQPNNSALQYKNKHKIQHSPAPIKNKSTYRLDRTASKNHTRNNSENDRLFTEPNEDKIDTFMHHLAKQLQSINYKRKAVENRIDKKLDQLSNKAHSMTKKYIARHPQNEEGPKKPKILTNSTKTNIDDNELEVTCLQRSNVKNSYNLNDKIPIHQNQPSERNKNIRNIIMNRIFS